MIISIITKKEETTKKVYKTLRKEKIKIKSPKHLILTVDYLDQIKVLMLKYKTRQFIKSENYIQFLVD